MTIAIDTALSRNRDNTAGIYQFGAFYYDDLGLMPCQVSQPIEQFSTAYGLLLYLKSKMNIIQGDLLNLCEQQHGDDYYGLIAIGKEHTAANRKWVMSQTPRRMRHKNLTFDHYEQLAARWIDDLGEARANLLALAAEYNWPADMLHDARLDLWEDAYGDLPYPDYARNPKEALVEWNAGGREAYAEKVARGPVLPRLEGCLQEARALSARYDILSDDGPWLRMSALLQLMASIIEELKA